MTRGERKIICKTSLFPKALEVVLSKTLSIMGSCMYPIKVLTIVKLIHILTT